MCIHHRIFGRRYQHAKKCRQIDRQTDGFSALYSKIGSADDVWGEAIATTLLHSYDFYQISNLQKLKISSQN